MLNQNIDFKLLNEYSTFRKDWRAKYKELTVTIRNQKLAFKAMQRGSEGSTGNERYELYKSQARATFMLNELEERKQRWKHYLTTLETSEQEAA